jgi:hypothetical protein
MQTIVGDSAYLISLNSVTGTFNGVPNTHFFVSDGTDLSVLAQEYQIPSLITANIISPPASVLNVTFAPQTFNLGSMQDYEIFGDLRDLLLIAPAFTQTLAGDWVGGISHYNFTLGGDSFTLGNGDNYIYGAMRDLVLEADGGVKDGLSNAVASYTLLNTFTFLSNTIVAGNGDNVIYGDLRDATFSAVGGQDINGVGLAPPDIIQGNSNGAFGEVFNNTLTTATNTITVGNGANTIYGEMRDLNLSVADGFILNGTVDAHHINETNGIIINFGTDTIVAGYGDNEIFGKVRDIDMSITGPTGDNALRGVQNQMASNAFSFGNDSIIATNGDNDIYGDFRDLTMSATGGVDDWPPSMGFPSVILALNSITIGANTISAGQGNNLIYGDGRDLTFEAIGGTAVTANGESSNRSNTITMGNNTITAGAGDNVISGGIDDLTLTAIGGLVESTGTAGLRSESTMRNETVTFGKESITAGNGDNIIYGDMHELQMTVHGGQVTTSFGGDASAHLLNTVITMHNNTITVGSGNDVLYGSLETLSFSAIAGTDSSGIGNVSASFSGNYTVPGTTPLLAIVDTGSTITFGNNTLVGGNGHDVLIGDALNLDGLDSFLTGLNKIVWGNATLTGGNGADSFVFALVDHSPTVMQMQGAQIVTDYNIKSDTLVFDNVLDVNHDTLVNAADLDAVASFVNFKIGSENEIAVIFHPAGIPDPAADYATAITNYLTAHPSSTLHDVAQFIYQSNAPIVDTLASHVPSAEAPQGAVILEGHSTAQAGFANFMAMANQIATALEVHVNTPPVHP